MPANVRGGGGGGGEEGGEGEEEDEEEEELKTRAHWRQRGEPAARTDEGAPDIGRSRRSRHLCAAAGGDACGPLSALLNFRSL